MTEERAAGGPAARLLAQVISEAQSLDEHRQRLTDGDPALAELLLGFEEEAVQGMAEQLRSSVAGIGFGNLTPPPAEPGVRDRIRSGLERFGPHRKHRKTPSGQTVVQGTVVPDEPPTTNGAAAAADPEAPTEPS